jgi:hypothetical protein
MSIVRLEVSEVPDEKGEVDQDNAYGADDKCTADNETVHRYTQELQYTQELRYTQELESLKNKLGKYAGTSDIKPRDMVLPLLETLHAEDCAYHITRELRKLVNVESELAARYVNKYLRAVSWQRNAALSCIISSPVADLQDGSSHDRIIKVMSKDRQICLGSINAKSICIYDVFGEEPVDTTIYDLTTMTWSDYSPTGETGSGLKDLMANLRDSEKRAYGRILKPRLTLKYRRYLHLPIGLYIHALKPQHILDIQIGHTTSEVLAFSDADINWGIEQPVSHIQSKYFQDYVSASEKFIENGTPIDTDDNIICQPSRKATGCNNCLKKESECKLLLCAKCKEIMYCSKDCQRADWPDHKPQCDPLRHMTSVASFNLSHCH